jgi:hypothetical protein
LAFIGYLSINLQESANKLIHTYPDSGLKIRSCAKAKGDPEENYGRPTLPLLVALQLQPEFYWIFQLLAVIFALMEFRR